ncbi:squalene monooxygenase (N-terminal region) [Tribonema minus]|uniref:squalene monooxygenase n=1 Tax=Tribonema minus TaxID=303371 RepID=A0A836CDI9_9STRA|nr:squalene monooxygenase (N-terminal region) [Tribonema minus]
MYSFLKEWEGALNRMNVFKLALPGLGVFASMTYFFGFFGISFVNSVLGTDNQAEPCELDSDKPNNSSGSNVDEATAAVASGPYARSAPASSAKYTLEQPEVVVIGAGTAGASLAIAFAWQGRRVTLIEKSFVLQDRIVGELMQPGGMRALETLGLAACATERCDSVRVDGYTVILPPGVSAARPDGAEAVLHYPDSDPDSLLQQFGAGVTLEQAAAAGGAGAPRGRSFHNCNFVARLREVARAEPNVRMVEGTVTQLVEEGGAVVGVRYKVRSGGEGGGYVCARPVHELRAPLTIVADGIWSGLRACANPHKPLLISSFVGVIVTHPPMASPVPHRHCGHVVLAQPSPILIYQISPTETRVLVDVAGKMPSAATGALSAFLVEQARWLPPVFRAAYLEAVAAGGSIKSMPNRALASSAKLKPGAILIGDALNMRHPLTGGGMTVALKDVALLATLLGGADLADRAAVARASAAFHRRRRGHAATINVLANALYAVFTTPVCSDDDGNGGDVTARSHLQDACFDYLSLGGAYAAGPIGLLSGLTPRPGVLAAHFFMVAAHGCRAHLLPLGFLNPRRWRHVYRLLSVACGIIMPLLEVERSTPLSWLPVRKAVQLLFPWEHLRWDA